MIAFPLRLALRPSRLLGVALAVAHAGAALVLWAAAAPDWASIAGTVVLGVSFGFHWLRDARLRLPRSVVALAFTRDRETGLRCEFTLRDGRRIGGRVLGSSVALPWLVVLGVRPDASRRSRRLALLPDALAREEHRALRVVLRWAYANDALRDPAAGRSN
ncbi:MAG TPA: protein YgfX [Burkholderiales bacterium]|nr:protein YgfX [Burkholderiales bacterium]